MGVRRPKTHSRVASSTSPISPTAATACIARQHGLTGPGNLARPMVLAVGKRSEMAPPSLRSQVLPPGGGLWCSV
jgi:hypothetical protein